MKKKILEESQWFSATTLKEGTRYGEKKIKIFLCLNILNKLFIQASLILKIKYLYYKISVTYQDL